MSEGEEDAGWSMTHYLPQGVEEARPLSREGEKEEQYRVEGEQDHADGSHDARSLFEY